VFALVVARRYLFSNPAQTALLIAGVALGVTAFVFITALIQGLAVRLTNDATGLRATSWQEKNANLEGALTAQAQTGTLIQIFSLISVLIGIASALSLSANRRSGEIGIMRAFGVSKTFIATVFVLQGLLIGAVGAGIGCVSGFALCSWLATMTNPDGTMVLPIAPSEGGYVAVFLLTTLGAVLASVIPARAAARLDPLEAIQQ
jgi:lipoprotein-releasing system permease protein